MPTWQKHATISCWACWLLWFPYKYCLDLESAAPSSLKRVHLHPNITWDNQTPVSTENFRKLTNRMTILYLNPTLLLYSLSFNCVIFAKLHRKNISEQEELFIFNNKVLLLYINSIMRISDRGILHRNWIT